MLNRSGRSAHLKIQNGGRNSRWRPKNGGNSLKAIFDKKYENLKQKNPDLMNLETTNKFCINTNSNMAAIFQNGGFLGKILNHRGTFGHWKCKYIKK